MTGESFRHLRVLKLTITYLTPGDWGYTWLDSETTLYVLINLLLNMHTTPYVSYHLITLRSIPS